MSSTLDLKENPPKSLSAIFPNVTHRFPSISRQDPNKSSSRSYNRLKSISPLMFHIFRRKFFSSIGFREPRAFDNTWKPKVLDKVVEKS